MELVLSLNSNKFINDFIQIGINYYVVGSDKFSLRQAISLDYNQLRELKNQIGNKKLWVLVNALIEEKNINDLKQHLASLASLNIDGLLFQDFAVLQICKENNYNFELIYQPDTLNTNEATLNFLGQQGINTAFLAREISIEQRSEIASHIDIKTVVQVHGVEYMAYSKRMLLSNYFKETNQVINSKSNYTIKANGIDYKCHIYEDKYGCHIVSDKQFCGLDVLSSFNNFDYLYIDSLYIDPLILVEIANLYQDGIISIKNNTYGKIKHELMPQLHQLTPNNDYHHSFMFDQTVYKIDDVRKREENEKSK